VEAADAIGPRWGAFIELRTQVGLRPSGSYLSAGMDGPQLGEPSGQSKCTEPTKWSLTPVSSSSPTPLPEPWSLVYAPVPLRMFQVKVSVEEPNTRCA